MEEKKLNRINELARKAKQTSLSAEELAEREALRNEYRADIKRSLEMSLDNCVIVGENGEQLPVKRIFD